MTAALSPPHLFPPLGDRRVRRHRTVAVPAAWAPAASGRPARPVLTVVADPPVRAASTSSPAYGRRRVAALALLVLLALPLQGGLVLVATRVLAPAPAVTTVSTGGAPTAATAAVATPGAPASPAAASGVYVVRSGDTLWSIARRLQPEGDLRPLVDTLAERAGGSALQAGQRLDIHGLGA